MFKEFKEFISKGNVMDLAIGVIIGSAFSDIVTALTSSFIQPLLALIGGTEVKGTIPLGDSGQALDYGAFLTAVINFLIVAFVLFMIVKAVNTANKKSKEKLEALANKVPLRNKKGSKIGVINYYFEDELIYKENVVLDKKINLNIIKLIKKYIVLIIVGIVVIFVIIKKKRK